MDSKNFSLRDYQGAAGAFLGCILGLIIHSCSAYKTECLIKDERISSLEKQIQSLKAKETIFLNENNGCEAISDEKTNNFIYTGQYLDINERNLNESNFLKGGNE